MFDRCFGEDHMGWARYVGAHGAQAYPSDNQHAPEQSLSTDQWAIPPPSRRFGWTHAADKPPLRTSRMVADYTNPKGTADLNQGNQPAAHGLCALEEDDSFRDGADIQGKGETLVVDSITVDAADVCNGE